jgi:dihydroxyacetone kinase-like predicted kinase
MQGYSALSVITPGITDIDALLSGAIRAAISVTDGEITRAVRDATIDGASIWQGDYMAISDGKIAAVTKTAEDAVLRLLEKVDADLCEIITLFTGKHVSEDKRAELTEQLEELYEDCEIIVYEGGQELYDYYVAIE